MKLLTFPMPVPTSACMWLCRACMPKRHGWCKTVARASRQHAPMQGQSLHLAACMVCQDGVICNTAQCMSSETEVLPNSLSDAFFPQPVPGHWVPRQIRAACTSMLQCVWLGPCANASLLLAPPCLLSSRFQHPAGMLRNAFAWMHSWLA